MSKQELLENYKQDVKQLQKYAKKLNLSDKDVDDLFNQSFKQLNNEIKGSTSAKALKCCKYFFIFISVIFCLYILLNVHQTTASIVLRNVQGLIYPGFKIVRYLSVPIIKAFPSLTDLYDESCLLENPYFYVSDMECWPCQNIHSVIDLTGVKGPEKSYKSGRPFIVKTSQTKITYTKLQTTYSSNKATFDNEASRIKSTNTSLYNLNALLSFTPKNGTTHISWRINKMVPARIIRGLFPRPYFVSEWSGQSVERYVMIDEANAAPYPLPNMECSYIFAVQGSGERTIILKPSKECSMDCRTVSVVLKPSYVLWYNWWYWRPISLPKENATDPSITYISSYC